MKVFQTILILVVLCAAITTASVVRRDVEDFDDDNDSDEVGNDDNDVEDLPIASIKSRAIAMDRELCRELSRYHPHHPRCQLYCEKLNHWMGMCRRESCHCYS